MIFPLIVLAVFCLLISYIDFRKYIIPDTLLVILLSLLLSYDILLMRSRIYMAFAAAVISFFMFFCIYRMYGGLGFGDVKFSAVLGYALGIPLLFVAFVLSSFLGIVYAAVCKKAKKTKIPFAPFLSLGALMTLIINRTGLLDFLCFFSF